MAQQNNNLQGLGGWMIFVQIALYASIILAYLFYLVAQLGMALNDSPISTYDVIIFTYVPLLVALLSLVSIILLYLKKKLFRIFASIVFGIYLLLLIDFMVGGIRAAAGGYILSGILALIPLALIIYLIRSQRVKNTFVN